MLILPVHTDCCAPSSPAACTTNNGRIYHMEWVGPRHRKRAELQQFIAGMFFKMHGAEIRHFSDTLLGCRGEEGHWIAALGFSIAADRTTFLEQYLDVPIESAIATRLAIPVKRHQIVEVGNLTALHAGAARELISSMTRHLYQQGFSWVAFTATQGLLNSFTRLRLQPVVLCKADPQRLPDKGKSWGNYYDTNPQVMFGDIRSGYAQLAK